MPGYLRILIKKKKVQSPKTKSTIHPGAQAGKRSLKSGGFVVLQTIPAMVHSRALQEACSSPSVPFPLLFFPSVTSFPRFPPDFLPHFIQVSAQVTYSQTTLSMPCHAMPWPRASLVLEPALSFFMAFCSIHYL